MTHPSYRAVLLGACAVLIFLAGAVCAAEFVPKVEYSSVGNQAVVNVNGRTAIRFRVSNGGLSPVERARITAERLKPLASSGGWKSITVKSVNKNRANVVVGEQLICIATAADAKAAGMSAQALAQNWAKLLREYFALPPITVEPKEIVVPENENRTANIGGALTGVIVSSDGNPEVATSTIDNVKRAIVVKGKSVGRSTIEIDCQGYKTTLTVNVKRYAAKVGVPAAIEVTGNPAPEWILAKAAESVASESIVLEPGATASFGTPKLTAKSLEVGKTLRVLVPVKTKGPNLIPADLAAPVDIINLPVSYKAADDLLYSNNPERLTRYGVLFTGKLELDKRSRLFFHHQNMLGKRVRFNVELINAGNTTAKVQTVSGISRPMVDTVVVGYVAGREFLRDYLDNVGLVHRIPPKSKRVLYADNLEHTNTASGIIDIRQLSGEDVYVKVSADVPEAGQLSSGATAPISDWHIPTQISDHVYPTPARDVEANYVVGGQWAFIRIGKYAIPDALSAKELQGNYGVIYRIKVRVENPSGEDRTIKVVFEPSAGPASGLFVINGKVVGIKVVSPPNEFEVFSTRVPAGQAKEFTILTMPLAGSAYPATLVVRP